MLRRRLRPGVILKRGKIDAKGARRETLVAYIWKEESTRIEEEEKQKERRMKQTGTVMTEIEEENEEGQEEAEVA